MAWQCIVVNFLFHDSIKCRFDLVSFDQLSGHDIVYTQQIAIQYFFIK